MSTIPIVFMGQNIDEIELSWHYRKHGYCCYCSTRWSKVNKTSTLDLSYSVDVYEGLEYLIRVSAENEAGQGPPCEPIGPILAKAPVGKCGVCATE